MSTPEVSLQKQLGELYIENSGWLQGWLKKKLNCSHRAADLLHDTFTKLLTNKSRIIMHEPKAYLMTVTKRVLIDHWRREQLEQAYLAALLELPIDSSPSPEEQHILFETLIEIDRLLDGLPIVVKRAFLCAQLDGLKQIDIAKKLNISVSTVKRYLVQAGVQCYFSVQI
jgi:RNA polymerase sigma-70 factor (ECF subfamily)